MKLSAVVPSFRRPASLARCLDGMASQIRPLDEVLVVVRPDDIETQEAVRRATLPARPVDVSAPGLLAAMRTGARAATGDVIAFTDDDAVARPGWAAQLEAHFADADVGAVGGRDVIPGETDGETDDFGRITPWGALVGNQHLAAGPAQIVDVLKGVNMAFRRSALALPTELRGQGSQMHSEVAICAWAASRGWRIVFDPELIVDHAPAWRPSGDDQLRRRRDARDASFNLVFGLISMRPELAGRRAVYGVLVGDALTPGLARTAAAAVRRERDVLRIAPAALWGQLAALTALTRGRRQRMVPVVDPP